MWVIHKVHTNKRHYSNVTLNFSYTLCIDTLKKIEVQTKIISLNKKVQTFFSLKKKKKKKENPILYFLKKEEISTDTRS